MPPLVPLARRAGTAVALCAALATCRFPTAPALPAGAEPLARPQVYATWWAMTESCSGVTGNLADVSFWQVPGADFDNQGRRVLGYWSSAGNRIVLAGDAALDGGNVRHEMLHALIRVGGHPRDQFLDKCAGVVDCGALCVEDAGPPPPADAAAVSVFPGAIDVALEIAPAAPSRAQDGGFFTLTVKARNPQARPVIAKLGASNIRAPSFQFSVRSATSFLTGTEVVLDASTVTFAPGETKRQVFDFSIGTTLASRRLPPGTYSVTGAYGSHVTSTATMVLAP